MNYEKEIRYFSMFTGVGGFELGIERANCNKQSSEIEQDWKGRDWNSDERERDVLLTKDSSFRCVGFSEIDKYANQLLAKRFPNIPNFGDCTKIEADKLPDFDMLCGGFPCQSFSIAGKRRGFQDTRGTMFFHIARILEVKRPKIVFLENVKGLLNHNKGETFKVILETLEELGYETQWMVLNSKFFGVPQNRERVFIIGSLRGKPRPEILPFGQNDGETFELQRQQITNTLTRRYEQSQSTGSYVIKRELDAQSQADRINSTEGISPTIPTSSGGRHIPMIKAILTPDREEKRQNGRRFKEDGEPSFTLTGQDIHGVMVFDDYNHKLKTDGIVGSVRPTFANEAEGNGIKLIEGIKIRRLTPIECERLQGFPDGWTEGFSDTQRYKMMGNAVTVNVIRAIAEKLT